MINIRDWEIVKFLRFVRARRATYKQRNEASQMTDTQRHEAVRRCQRREATGLPPVATELEIQAAEEAQRRRRTVGLPLDAPEALVDSSMTVSFFATRYCLPPVFTNAYIGFFLIITV